MFKDISWFDSKERAPGILSNILSEDINALNGLTTESIGIMLECILSMLLGMALSFYFTWKMALITLGVVPLVALGGMSMAKL